MLARLVRIVCAASVVSALVLVPLSPVLLRTFFGSAFMPALVPMRFLLFSSAVTGIARVALQGLRAFGWPLTAGVIGGAGTTATALALLLLLPKFGIVRAQSRA